MEHSYELQQFDASSYSLNHQHPVLDSNDHVVDIENDGGSDKYVANPLNILFNGDLSDLTKDFILPFLCVRELFVLRAVNQYCRYVVDNQKLTLEDVFDWFSALLREQSIQQPLKWFSLAHQISILSDDGFAILAERCDFSGQSNIAELTGHDARLVQNLQKTLVDMDGSHQYKINEYFHTLFQHLYNRLNHNGHRNNQNVINGANALLSQSVMAPMAAKPSIGVLFSLFKAYKDADHDLKLRSNDDIKNYAFFGSLVSLIICVMIVVSTAPGAYIITSETDQHRCSTNSTAGNEAQPCSEDTFDVDFFIKLWGLLLTGCGLSMSPLLGVGLYVMYKLHRQEYEYVVQPNLLVSPQPGDKSCLHQQKAIKQDKLYELLGNRFSFIAVEKDSDQQCDHSSEQIEELDDSRSESPRNG